MLAHLVETAINTGFIFFPLLIISVVGWYYVFSLTLFVWKEKRVNKGKGEELGFFVGILVMLQMGERLFQKINLGKLSVSAKSGTVTLHGVGLGSLHVQLEKELQKCNEKEIIEKKENFVVQRLGGAIKAVATVKILAGLAPLLGLLGTVSGMIDTFEIISVYGNANPTLLAEGIAKALLTTQFGLAVALPLLLSIMSLSSKIRRLELSLLNSDF